MTLQEWTDIATAAAQRSGLADLPALVRTLAAATAALRAADWNVAADASAVPPTLAPDLPVEAGSVRPSMSDAGSAPRASAGPPHLRPLSEIALSVRARHVSSRELTEACLAEIERQDPALNAFITVTAALAREQAEAVDREIAAGHYRGPLHGIPVSLKDLVDLAGVPTTAASRVRAGTLAERDAIVTALLRAAGAVFVGKCNLHEFALGTTSEDSAFGPVRHPRFPDRSPGGSSGGSAVSVASGMAFASVGTDTGGSIRIPAAACGLVGFKPPFGVVAADGVVPLSASLDHVGPLARTVRDASLLFESLSGRPFEPQARAARTLRLGLLRPYFMDVLDPGVREVFERALDRLRASGATILDRTVPHAPLTAPVYLHTGLAEAAAYHAPTLETRGADYTPPVRVRLELGRLILAEDYARAQVGRAVLRSEVDAALRDLDALVLPTLPIVAPRLGTSSVDIDGVRESVRNATLRLTQLFDLTGHPAISIPAGTTAEDLPVGLQLVGRHAGSRELLGVAEAVEKFLTSR